MFCRSLGHVILLHVSVTPFVDGNVMTQADGSLLIRNMADDLFGLFTCQATNQVGSSSALVVITSEGMTYGGYCDIVNEHNCHPMTVTP